MEKFAFHAWNGCWLTAEFGGGAWLVANRNGAPGGWEFFEVQKQNVAGEVTLSMGDFFVTAEPSGAVFCNRKQANQWELWRMEERPGGNFAFKSFHNKYLSVQPGGAVVADRGAADSWETFARSGPLLLPVKPGK